MKIVGLLFFGLVLGVGNVYSQDPIEQEAQSQREKAEKRKKDQEEKIQKEILDNSIAPDAAMLDKMAYREWNTVMTRRASGRHGKTLPPLEKVKGKLLRVYLGCCHTYPDWYKIDVLTEKGDVKTVWHPVWNTNCPWSGYFNKHDDNGYDLSTSKYGVSFPGDTEYIEAFMSKYKKDHGWLPNEPEAKRKRPGIPAK
jgi:hypothetical protein